MTVADLLFILQHLNPKKKIYIAHYVRDKKREGKSVYVVKGKYVLFAVEEPYL